MAVLRRRRALSVSICLIALLRVRVRYTLKYGAPRMKLKGSRVVSLLSVMEFVDLYLFLLVSVLLRFMKCRRLRLMMLL